MYYNSFRLRGVISHEGEFCLLCPVTRLATLLAVFSYLSWSNLFILNLQRGQPGLELSETEGELGLDLLLGDNLGHLTGRTRKQ